MQFELLKNKMKTHLNAKLAFRMSINEVGYPWQLSLFLEPLKAFVQPATNHKLTTAHRARHVAEEEKERQYTAYLTAASGSKQARAIYSRPNLSANFFWCMCVKHDIGRSRMKECGLYIAYLRVRMLLIAEGK